VISNVYEFSRESFHNNKQFENKHRKEMSVVASIISQNISGRPITFIMNGSDPNCPFITPIDFLRFPRWGTDN